MRGGAGRLSISAAVRFFVPFFAFLDWEEEEALDGAVGLGLGDLAVDDEAISEERAELKAVDAVSWGGGFLVEEGRGAP